MHFLAPRIPNLHACRSTISPLGFPIHSHVKISKCHKIFGTRPMAKKSNSLYSFMVANVLMKFGEIETKL